MTWQWKSDSGWVNFGDNERDTLEDAYNTDSYGTCPLYIGDQSYNVDFSVMEQENLGSKKKRAIRRLTTKDKKDKKKTGPPIKKKIGVVDEEKGLIKLLETQEYADVTLKTNQGSVKAHKFLLCRNDHIRSLLEKCGDFLVVPCQESAVKSFLEFCYLNNFDVVAENILPTYQVAKFFKLEEMEQYILARVAKPLKNSKYVFFILSEIEEIIRKESPWRFQHDNLKERMLNMFSPELIAEKDQFNAYQSLMTDLKMEIITWTKTEIPKPSPVEHPVLRNVDFPDTKFMTTKGDVVPIHRALIHLESKECAKKMGSSMLTSCKSEYLQWIVDFFYNGVDLKVVAKNDLDGFTKFVNSIDLPSIIEGPEKTYFGRKKGLLCFDSEHCSENTTISEDGKSCTYNGPDGFQGAVLCTYAEEWTVRLGAPCGYLMIGMCNHNMSKNGVNYSTQNGHYLYLGTGGLYGAGQSNSTYTSSSWGVKGTVIKINWDPIEGTITYTINGTNLGIAYKGLQGKELFPAFDFYNKGTILELID